MANSRASLRTSTSSSYRKAPLFFTRKCRTYLFLQFFGFLADTYVLMPPCSKQLVRSSRRASTSQAFASSRVLEAKEPFGILFDIGNQFRSFHVRFRDVTRGGTRIVRSGKKHISFPPCLSFLADGEPRVS